VALVMLSASAIAQETATERDAGRGVLEKMEVLERSLDIPNIVSRLTGPNDARDRVVARARELMDTELLGMADDIATHPEIGFEEKRTVQKLTDYLKQHDFDVQIGVAGLPTAFIAKYKRSSGAPTLGVILEYDALRGSRGPFHGDQHSAQGPVGMAAAIAVAEGLSLTQTPGGVVVYGTPGEEIMPPNAKTVMHQAHVFDGADIIVRSHSMRTTSPLRGLAPAASTRSARSTFSSAPRRHLVRRGMGATRSKP
jgi:metal-dependent amidase/aminoacylase/carboxypeptidase family protein